MSRLLNSLTRDRIISLDQHITNSDKRLTDTVHLNFLGKWFVKGAICQKAIPLHAAKELIKKHDLMDISASGQGIDAINPDKFTYAHLGVETDEYHDQTYLATAFKHAAQFGVPYSPDDEDLTKRLVGWDKIEIDGGQTLIVNPKYRNCFGSYEALLPDNGTKKMFSGNFSQLQFVA